MECLGPQCASMLLEWLRGTSRSSRRRTAAPESRPAALRQGLLWTAAPYSRRVARDHLCRRSSPVRSNICSTRSSGGFKTS